MSSTRSEFRYSCTTTSVEGAVQIALLSNPENKPCLMTKAIYTVRFPRRSLKLSNNGQIIVTELKQAVMSFLIRADEYLQDYCRYCKAEVSFDMSRLLPTPFLSTSGTRPGSQPDPNRRRTFILPD